MSGILKDLLVQLDLERLEENLFRGDSRDIGGRSVFGGQVLGQALMAAGRTVEDRRCHSIHGYFLRPGDMEAPIVYEVDRIRDGRSFTTRRVVAIQHGRAIFNLSASFQVVEDGVEHQSRMPDLPGPDGLMSETELRREVAHRVPEKVRDVFTRERAIEIRPVEPIDLFEPAKHPPRKHCWIRARGSLPDDFALHQCMLAYASDFTLLSTAARPHGLSFLQRHVQAASLDHAMWFHREFRMDDWLLYVQDSPSASNGRGFNRGSLYTRDSRLIASVAQEGLILIHPE